MTDTARLTLQRMVAERAESLAGLSKLIGRNPAYLQQFVKRGTPRRLEEDDRRILARYLGIGEELLGGQLERRDGGPAVAMVRRLSLGASAGAGAIVNQEQPVGVMAFDAAWLRDLGVRPDRASIIRVDGESMAPTLRNGDEIMVDHDDGPDRLRDGVYVLRLDGVLMVKRVAIGPARERFSVLSDNPRYPDWANVDPAHLSIVGRVVWQCRRFG